MSEQARPKRVIILDAENPMEEINGEFFWREDHDRILESERQDAFNRGYAEGFATAARQAGQQGPQVVYWRHRFSLRRLFVRAFVLFVVVCYLVTLVQSFHSR